jgi:hypothetical protein
MLRVTVRFANVEELKWEKLRGREELRKGSYPHFVRVTL